MPKVTRHRNFDATQILQDDLEKIKDALFDATVDVKKLTTQGALDAYSHLKSKSTDIQEGVVAYVEEKPLKALGLAMMAGLFFGLYLRK